MKRIGLYFGTFQPNTCRSFNYFQLYGGYTNLDEVWLVVSPLNPLKKKESLLKDYHRLNLVRIAIEDNPKT